MASTSRTDVLPAWSIFWCKPQYGMKNDLRNNNSYYAYCGVEKSLLNF